VRELTAQAALLLDALRPVNDRAVTGAAEVGHWALDADPMPAPRSVAQLRRDPEVKASLAEGDALALVPLVQDAGRPVKANLSLDAGLLAAIDEAARARGLSRSAFPIERCSRQDPH
jgi:hypothetical protein